jgi:hypothetical protein
MPATKIFDLSDLNVAGICHAICCKWVREGIRRGMPGVTSEQELGSRIAMFMMFELPQDADDIIEKYHLKIVKHSEPNLQNRTFDAVMQELMSGTGYKILAIGSFRLHGDEHQHSAHSMAIRRTSNSVQFFDPNEGAWRFDNSVELYEWLPSYIRANATYRRLLGDGCDIWTVTA